jgi:D-alanyl-lipoteichoic acid acyltransferase DltB (MBOAT superfamily)
MVFNSLDFILYLFIVYILYWYIVPKNREWRNFILLLASNFFYAYWDYRFLVLLNSSIALDYFIGIGIFSLSDKRKKKILLVLSISINLTILCIFKYYNFFVESFLNLFSISTFGNVFLIKNLILPVGISFYTFHELSYIIDVYNNKIKPEKSFLKYSLFVSFFPLLVAGPIERADHLLPQINKSNKLFDYNNTISGLQLILWGFFKKIVIADNCAQFSNQIFQNYYLYNGSTLILGGIFFSFQIYADFSAYSEIAIGVGKLFGFELFKNFNYPYFSKSIIDFWARWHISLTSWFKDYLYIPLGGNRHGTAKMYFNIILVFLVSGLWHGANWTFLIWGSYHGLLICFNKLISIQLDSEFYSKRGTLFLRNIFIFLFILFGWIIFRSVNIEMLRVIISKIFSPEIFQMPYFENGKLSIITIFLISLMMFIEFLSFRNRLEYGLDIINQIGSKRVKYFSYYIIILFILYFGSFYESTFIYFQF